MTKLKDIHPGEILMEEFLIPLEISQNALARAINVPPCRINEIVLGKRGITTDTALRLSRAFGTSEGFWMGLQADYDMEETRKRIDGALKNVEKLAGSLVLHEPGLLVRGMSKLWTTIMKKLELVTQAKFCWKNGSNRRA